MGTITKCLRLPVEQKILLLRSFVLLALIRIGLKCLRLHTLLKLLDCIQRSSNRRDLSNSPACSVEAIAWAVAAATRLVPRASCLTQALAARAMLLSEGLPSSLHLGVAKTEKGALEAHAWLECQGKIVTGGSPDLERYALLLPDQTTVSGNNSAPFQFLAGATNFEPDCVRTRLNS